MRNIFLYPIEAVNTVRTNVWSVILISMGTVLILHGHTDAGGSLVTGGFALLRTEALPASQEPLTVPTGVTLPVRDTPKPDLTKV